MILVLAVAEDAIDRVAEGFPMGAVYALVKIRHALRDGPKSIAAIARLTGVDRDSLRTNIGLLADEGLITAVGLSAGAGRVNAGPAGISENAGATGIRAGRTRITNETMRAPENAGPAGIRAGATRIHAGAASTNAGLTRTNAAPTGISENAGPTRTNAGPTGIHAGPTGTNAGLTRLTDRDLGDIYTSSFRDTSSTQTSLFPEGVENLTPNLPLPEVSPSQEREVRASDAATKRRRATRAEVKARRLAVAGEAWERFAEAWHPNRRVDMDEAAKAFARAVASGEDPEAIIAGARRYTAHELRVGTDPRYVKHPARWIEKRRWLDSLPEPIELTREQTLRLAIVQRAIEEAGRLAETGVSWQARALIGLGRLGFVTPSTPLPPEGVAEVEGLRAELERVTKAGIAIPSPASLRGDHVDAPRDTIPRDFAAALAAAMEAEPA